MFHHPWFLILLPLVPLVGWRLWTADRENAVSFSSAVVDWNVRPTWRQRLLWLPPALTLCALTLMIVSLARPRHGREQTIINSEGIAIEMVVDRSGSMQALDFQIDGRSMLTDLPQSKTLPPSSSLVTKRLNKPTRCRAGSAI